MAEPDVFPDPRRHPTMTIPQAAGFYGLGTSAAYDAAARGDIPTIRFGRRLIVPTATAARQLGLHRDDFARERQP